MEGDDELAVCVEQNLLNRATQSILYENCLDIQMTVVLLGTMVAMLKSVHSKN